MDRRSFVTGLAIGGAVGAGAGIALQNHAHIHNMTLHFYGVQLYNTIYRQPEWCMRYLDVFVFCNRMVID